MFFGVQAKLRPVAVLSGRTFADALMVALLPIDIGKSATLIISILKIMESVKEELKREILIFLITTITHSNRFRLFVKVTSNIQVTHVINDGIPVKPAILNGMPIYRYTRYFGGNPHGNPGIYSSWQP